MVLAQGFSWGCGHDVGMASINSWRPFGGLEDSFTRAIHTHTWLVNWDLHLVGRPQFLAIGPSSKGCWSILNSVSSGFPLSKWCKRVPSRSLMMLCQEPHTIISPAWIQRVRSIGNNLGIWLAQLHFLRLQQDFITQGRHQLLTSSIGLALEKVTPSASKHKISQKVSDWPRFGSYVLLWNKSPWFASPGPCSWTLRPGTGGYAW